MTTIRHLAASSLLLAVAGAAIAQPPQQAPVPPNPMGDDPTRRPIEHTDNDIIGRTDQTQKAMDAAAEARMKKKGQTVDAVAVRGMLRAKPAKAADLVVGALVTDRFGARVGAIASLAGADAVVATDLGPIRVPAEALGKSSKGLLVDMDKKSFDALVAQANATASN